MARRSRRGVPALLGGLRVALTADLPLGTVGFRVAGRARARLECIAEAGDGRYYDAPDARALARLLQRAGQLAAAGYRFTGKQARGTATRSGAPVLVPGQYPDSSGPHEERYYATDPHAVSAADFSATVVPPSGAAVGSFDAWRTRVAYGGDGVCDSTTELFGHGEGATPLTAGVSRIPTRRGTGGCDKAGRYRLVVERGVARGSDAARWPRELTFHVEHPQTLWYKVPVGWGQQLCHDVEFANQPRTQGAGASASYGRAQVYTPVGSGTGEFSPQVLYNGRPASLSMGTLPVAWTHRYESQAGCAMAAASRRDSGPSADTAQDSGGGWSTARVAAVAVGGVGVLLPAGPAPAYVRPRRRPAAADGNADPRRGGSW